jgi:hypothetical protein
MADDKKTKGQYTAADVEAPKGQYTADDLEVAAPTAGQVSPSTSAPTTPAPYDPRVAEPHWTEPEQSLQPENLTRNIVRGAKGVLGTVTGLASDIDNPKVSWGDIGRKYISDPAQREFQKAIQAPTMSEMVGHGTAGVLAPIGGAAMAEIGEQAGAGDVGGAAGNLSGQLMGGKILSEIGRLGVNVGKETPTAFTEGPAAAGRGVFARTFPNFTQRKLGAGPEATDLARDKAAADQTDYQKKLTGVQAANKDALARHQQAVDALSAKQGEAAQATKDITEAQAKADKIAQSVAKALPEAQKASYAHAQKLYGKDPTGFVPQADTVADLEGILKDKLKGAGPVPTSIQRILKGSYTDEAGEPVVFDEDITAKNLHGMLSEVGRELGKGNLPPDSMSALSAAHDYLESKLKGLYEEEGRGAEFDKAQQYYKAHANTFWNASSVAKGGSPIARAITTRDPVSGELRPEYVGKYLTQGDPHDYAQKTLANIPETAPLASQIGELKKAAKAASAKAPNVKVSIGTPKLQAEPEAPPAFNERDFKNKTMRERGVGQLAGGTAFPRSMVFRNTLGRIGADARLRDIIIDQTSLPPDQVRGSLKGQVAARPTEKKKKVNGE